MFDDSLRQRLLELLAAEKARAEAEFAALKTHPITGKRLEASELTDPFPPGATDRKLSAFMRRTGMHLQASFCDWLKITNGAAGFYGVRPCDRRRDLENVWKHWPEWQQRWWTPVADDGFGNFYVQPNRDAVCFIDTLHSANRVAYVVASNALHFALFLLENRQGLHEELAQSRGFDVQTPKSGAKRATGMKPASWPFNRKYMLFRDPQLKEVKDLPTPWDKRDSASN
jgi:hypothetical protein